MSFLKLRESIALIGFVVLFPGFAVYHQLIALNIIGPIFSGLFGPFSALVVILFLFEFLFRNKYKFTDVSYIVIVIFFIFYCFVVTLINLIPYSQYAAQAANQSFAIIIQWISLFLIGYYLDINKINKIKTILIMFLIFSAILLTYQYLSSGMVVYNARNLYNTDNDVATYEGFARSFSVTLLLVMALYRSSIGMTPIWILGLPLLIMLGARSDFYGFVALLPLVIFFDKNRSRKLLVVLLSSAFVLPFLYTLIMNSRQSQILDLSESSSWQARNELLEFAVMQLIESPILGNFGGHFLYAGGSGSHSHNILSVWVNYGVLGFFIYISLCFFSAFGSFKLLLKYRSDTNIMFCFLIACFSIILMISSKPVFWPVPALAWGVYSSLLANKGSLRNLKRGL